MQYNTYPGFFYTDSAIRVNVKLKVFLHLWVVHPENIEEKIHCGKTQDSITQVKE